MAHLVVYWFHTGQDRTGQDRTRHDSQAKQRGEFSQFEKACLLYESVYLCDDSQGLRARSQVSREAGSTRFVIQTKLAGESDVTIICKYVRGVRDTSTCFVVPVATSMTPHYAPSFLMILVHNFLHHLCPLSCSVK